MCTNWRRVWRPGKDLWPRSRTTTPSHSPTVPSPSVCPLKPVLGSRNASSLGMTEVEKIFTEKEEWYIKIGSYLSVESLLYCELTRPLIVTLSGPVHSHTLRLLSRSPQVHPSTTWSTSLTPMFTHLKVHFSIKSNLLILDMQYLRTTQVVSTRRRDWSTLFPQPDLLARGSGSSDNHNDSKTLYRKSMSQGKQWGRVNIREDETYHVQVLDTPWTSKPGIWGGGPNLVKTTSRIQSQLNPYKPLLGERR